MMNKISGRRTGGSAPIEMVLQNLKESEDKAINQLIQGEISVGTYCKWLIRGGF